jgi:hypothetical protein
MKGVRQHCAQCLTDVLANGRQTPTGELLCSSCHTALWGPSATDALREMVSRHSGRPGNGNGHRNGNGRLNGHRVAAAQR